MPQEVGRGLERQHLPAHRTHRRVAAPERRHRPRPAAQRVHHRARFELLARRRAHPAPPARFNPPPARPPPPPLRAPPPPPAARRASGLIQSTTRPPARRRGTRPRRPPRRPVTLDRKSTRLNSSHGYISYAVFCLKKKNKKQKKTIHARPSFMSR